MAPSQDGVDVDLSGVVHGFPKQTSVSVGEHSDVLKTMSSENCRREVEFGKGKKFTIEKVYKTMHPAEPHDLVKSSQEMH